jgi:hypothetical protein
MGRYLQSALPPNAVLLAYQQAGALAHYTRRPIARLDMLVGHALDEVVNDLTRRGLRPVVVLDEGMEIPSFRAVFAASPLGALDWPARARATDAEGAILVFDPADRTSAVTGVWPTDVVGAR